MSEMHCYPLREPPYDEHLPTCEDVACSETSMYIYGRQEADEFRGHFFCGFHVRRLMSQPRKTELRDWEVVWTQGLLIFAGMDLEWETLEDGLTREEAEGPKLREWQNSLNGAVGVLVKARQKPAPKENVDETVEA